MTGKRSTVLTGASLPVRLDTLAAAIIDLAAARYADGRDKILRDTSAATTCKEAAEEIRQLRMCFARNGETE